jgi:4-hydroxy-3-polyprenylbenzoate decarboxylase
MTSHLRSDETIAVGGPRAAGAVGDLREWLRRIEELGELRRIAEEVDPVEEMGALTYLVGKRPGSPALLFERPKDGSGYRLLWNLLGNSTRRIALTIGEDPAASRTELVQALRAKLRRRVPSIEIARDAAPVNERVRTGAKIDLSAVPAPKHWPLDGGRYLGTCDAVLTRDPDSGRVNMGTYRVMVHDERHVGLYLSPGKDARLHIARAWELGRPIEVVIACGIDPLLMLVASLTFPKNESEVDAVGGIAGAPLELTRGVTTDLPIPARAEFVLEGVIRPNATRLEGPFGEFTGYYGRPEAGAPLVEVTAIHTREDPILTNALMSDYPSCEMADYYAIAKAARTWDDLDKLGIPGIRGVYAHPAAASGFGMVVISLQQRYAGHVAQALACAAQAPGAAYFTKWIVAVDEDVDPTDMDQVIWAMATRCNPAEDIDILRNTWSTWLDPTQNPPEERPWGSKALINACKEHRYLSVFSKRTTVRRATYERLAERWQRLGLDAEAPRLLAFHEEDGRRALHEAAEFKGEPSSPNGPVTM